MTGNAFLQNRFYDGESLGAIVHFNASVRIIVNPRSSFLGGLIRLFYDW